MSHVTYTMLLIATWPWQKETVEELVSQACEEQKQVIVELVSQLLAGGVTPESTREFETQLAELVRELGRSIVEEALNAVEPDPEALPHDVTWQCGGYRRLNEKTANRQVSTTFGKITLHRHGYRYWHRGFREKTIFPLEMQLGLVCGATPALAYAVGRYTAEATQKEVLARLREQHNVDWGEERLRNLSAAISQDVFEHLRPALVARVLELLQRAYDSRGNRKPVLAVGRDGITLREHRHRYWEVASAATVTVYDRAGKRLASVYLAFVPESDQVRMTDELTALINDILSGWEGPLPRLAYVTDAGDNETKFYDRVLHRMMHPRTGEQLDWQRIVDFYHASERIWTMASLWFRNEDAAHTWAVRMCQLLKTSNGPFRVLQSAAAILSQRKRPLSKKKQEEYAKAVNYIRTRSQYMQYAEYKANHLPIGSGVTESACKMIFTQRLKRSGMRWSRTGGQIILNLRVAVLSGVYDAVYSNILISKNAELPKVYVSHHQSTCKIAA